MKTKTPKARVTKTKIPRAQVLYGTHYANTKLAHVLTPLYYGRIQELQQIPCLVQPFRTRAAADKAKKWANMSYGDKMETMAKLLAPDCGKHATEVSQAVLAAMGVEP